MNQPLLHDTCQYSPGGLVVSVTDSGWGGYGVLFPPHHFFFFALSDNKRDSKIMYFFFLLCSLTKNNNKYQILNKSVVILKF